MLFSEQTRGWTVRSLRATWCPRAPLWWLLRWTMNMHRSKKEYTNTWKKTRIYTWL